MSASPSFACCRPIGRGRNLASWTRTVGALFVSLTLLPVLPPSQAQDITNLIGYWPANEGSGTVVGNLVDPETHGTLHNGSWTADAEGHTGLPGDYAFEITGEAGGQSHVEVPPTGVVFEEITITAWLKGAPAGEWSGIVYSRSAQAIGLDFSGSSGNLTYTWNNNSGETWGFASDLNVPDDRWTFVAMSLRADGNTLYVGTTGENGQLSSAVNAIEHIPQTHDQAPFLFGVDLCCGNQRNFDGLMDDIAIWDVALTEEQIRSLWEGSATPLDVFDNSDPGVVLPPRQDFGRLPFIAGTQELTFHVTNSGQAETLTLDWEILPPATGPSAFALVQTPATLAPGATSSVTLTFDPRGLTGQFVGHLQVRTNDPDLEDQDITLPLLASIVDPSGPVAHFSLDDPTGTSEIIDLTGNGRSGIYVVGPGAITWEEPPLAAGNAIRLSGGANVSVPSGLAELKSFTASLWIEAAPSDFSVLLANGSTETPGFAVLLTQGDLQWFFEDTGVFTTNGAPVTPNEPHHVGIVYRAPSAESGAEAVLYVDGQEVATESVDPVDLSDRANILSFGGLASNPGLSMEGLIDDIQLYDRALTEEEIQQLEQNPGTTLTSTGAVDSDGDGLTDEDEALAGTNPLKADTDGDFLADGEEVQRYQTDPLQVDSDGDGAGDAAEALFGGAPTDPAVGLGTFLVRNVTAAPPTVFTHMDTFKEALGEPAQLGREVTVTAGVINYRDNAEGRFPQNLPFPVFGEEGAHDDFGLHVTGTFTLDQGGLRTFGVNSDDGFQLYIDGELVIEFLDPRGSADTLGAVALEAGDHTLELFYYERGGGAHVELFVNAQLGAVESFDAGHFLLLPASGQGDADTDGDGLPDFWEGRYLGGLDASPTEDPDGDGLDNAAELAMNTLPHQADTDGDGRTDGQEATASPPTDPLSRDTDEDGLTDGDETTRGTEPTNPDTDGDGVSDGGEVARGTDPLDPNSTPEILATAYVVPQGTVGNQEFGGSLGHDFIVEKTVQVMELGVFDSGSDGLNLDLTVELWRRDDGGTPEDPGDDVAGERLTTIAFTSADAGVLVGGSRFKSLPQPLTLTPGGYTVAAFGYGGGESNGNQGSVDLGLTTDDGDGALRFVGGGRFGDAGTWPGTPDGGPANRYAAGTFAFRPVIDGGGGSGLDSDGDGVSDADEALAGTDPADPSDYFRVMSTSHDGTNVTLEWKGVAGIRYVVEVSSTLESNGWTTINAASPLVGAGEVLNLAIPAETPSGFYRLRTLPAP